jgi:branched-chain amino acid transport system substrate-binding protein
MRRLALVVTLLAFGFGAARADDLKIGYLGATTGPFAALAKRNAIAVEVAVDDINAHGGVNGKKLSFETFDTGGKPDQAVIGVTHFGEDTAALAVVGPYSTSECRVAFPAGERLGIPEMSMASSAPKVAAPFTYAFRNPMSLIPSNVCLGPLKLRATRPDQLPLPTRPMMRCRNLLGHKCFRTSSSEPAYP